MSRIPLGRQHSAPGVGRPLPADLPYDMPDQFDGGRAHRQEVRHHPRGRRLARPGVAEEGGPGAGRGSLRPRDRRPSRRRSSARRARGASTCGEKMVVTKDQGPRDTTAEGLAKLKAGAARRHAHRGELVADLRRRGRRALDVRGAGQGRGPHAPGARGGPGARRLRPLLPPRRPDRRPRPRCWPRPA